MNYKKIILIMTLLFIGIVFAEYLGGRRVLLTDQFFIELPNSRGIIDCFEFNCLNGTCLWCSQGVYKGSLVYDSHMSLSSKCDTLKEDSISIFSSDSNNNTKEFK